MSENINELEFEFEDGDEILEDDLLDELDEFDDADDLMGISNNDNKDNNNYLEGSPVDSSELMDDESDNNENTDSSFISGSGDFVVMEDADSDTAFELKLIDIEKIAVTKRVRQNISVEDITRSIKSTGLLAPVMVAPLITDGMYVLLDGYRRLMGCARAGKRIIPAIVNNKVSTAEISILESMYNHSRKYTIKEIVDYIDYLEKEKGIMNPSMIEYLLQMNSGEYTKLKDILNDNDEDITEKLFSGAWDIETAFRKLEQRRKKESMDEKENRKAAAVYDDEEASGIDQISGAGEEADGDAIPEETLNSIMLNASDLDEGLEESSLDDMVKEGSEMKSFKPHKQKVGEREYIDPIIKKTVMARDKYTCQCCLKGGESYVDALDYHHILPVFLSGTDTVENGIMLCLTCHRLVHLYSTGDLHIPPEKTPEEIEALTEEEKILYNEEQMRFKRIVKLGMVIRRGMEAKGIKKSDYKKAHSNEGIGRGKPEKTQEEE